VIFWNPKTGERLAMLEGHKEGVSGVAISPDDKTVAVVCGNNTIKLWNVPTRREVGNLAFARALMFVDFSPDGRYLIGHNPWNPDTRFDFWEAPPTARK
jgi:WD40 repeat protein